MVHLGGDRVTAGRKFLDPVQSLDHHHFPERPRLVEWPRVKSRQVDTELAPVTGLRQAAVLHVVFEIEILVVGPVGKVEFEGNAHEAAPKHRAHVQAALDMCQDLLETNDLLARHRGRIENRGARYLDVIVRCFHVQELGVLRTELRHHESTTLRLGMLRRSLS